MLTKEEVKACSHRTATFIDGVAWCSVFGNASGQCMNEVCMFNRGLGETANDKI